MTNPVKVGDWATYGRIIGVTTAYGQRAYIIISRENKMFLLSAIIVEGRN